MHNSTASRNSGAASRREPVFLAFGLAAGAALLVLLAKPLLLLFAGFLAALVLRAAASFLARHTPVPYLWSLGVCVLLGIGAGVTVIALSGATVASEFHDLGVQLPKALDAARSSLHLPKGGSSENALGNLQKVGEHALPAFSGSLEVLSGLVVLFFLGIYGAADPQAYRRIVLWFVPAPRRPRVRHILTEATNNLERWLIGRLLAMAFVAVACGIAFLLLHVPLALPLAVLAGLLTFVEYVGAVASGIPPVLLAFSESPARALWVLVFFTVLHIVEGYVLTPLLARTTVHLPPANTLATQVLLAALLGPLGLTFATPLLVVAVTVAQEWRHGSAETARKARAAAHSPSVRPELSTNS